MTTVTSPSVNTATSLRASIHGTGAPASFSYSDDLNTQLPQVEFNFEDLRRRMADFTIKFDAFIDRGRKRVLEERNDFKARLGELNEEQRSTSTQISALQTTLSSHNHLLSRESSEKEEITAQIKQLQIHAQIQHANRDKLQQAISQTQRQIDVKVLAQREYAERMASQERLNGPELEFWERMLAVKIDGGGDEGMIRVTYTFPPKKDTGHAEDQTAVFELQVPDSGTGKYEIVQTKPRLDQIKVAKVVEKLNGTREIATLLKGMRGLFAAELGDRMVVR